MEIKDRIRIKRHEKGLTQKQLGELSGIHEVQIRKYERGEVLPKLENIKKIANGLSIRPIDLLGDDWFIVKGSEADGKTDSDVGGVSRWPVKRTLKTA